MSDPRLRQLLLEKYEPIAIVGAGLRFPGDNDSLAGFTEFLAAGRSGIVPIPADRWDVPALAADGGDEPGKVRTTGGGFLNGLDQFDAKFFNISPKESQFVDPQQRLVLETAWAALESANIDPTGLRHGDGGVFMGIGSMDYLLELEAMRREDLDGFLGTGTAHSAVSGRLSYFLGWRGPCVSIDTACSSSLVAVHQAVQALRRGECSIALAGGVNAIHHPITTIVFSSAGMLAPDGRCKTFDDSADGYARGEGCGVLVLKRLSDARQAGDRILALIRGSAVRQDGESGGLTVPNGTAQAMVMRAALAASAVDPSDVSYVEAHGTGTPLGDPIEMGSINEVFAESHRGDPLIVGSVKTNLGHLEIAAGVAGIIKTVLQMRAGQVFPHINFDKPSGRIPWDRYPVVIPTGVLPWDRRQKRAIVNSFGFTGTIATVVVEEAPAVSTTQERDDGPQVFTVSAKNAAALRGQLARWRDFLAGHPAPLSEVCRSAALGRAHFPVRVAGVVREPSDLDALLAAEPPQTARDLRKVAFLFTGQGSQHAGMGEALRRFAVFADHYDACDELFRPHLGGSLRELTAGQVNQTRFTQPALFAVEYAAAKLWLSWGVRPSVLIGHSIGEIAAAAVAGLFTLPDAVRLVAARAEAMQAVTAPGGMLAVTAPADQVRPLLDAYPDLALAAVNAPEQCVVSGAAESLTAFAAALPFPGKALTVSHAFHSPLMREAAERFRAAIEGIAFGEPELTLVSNVTGRVARPSEISNVDYWVRHLLEPVDFAAGMTAVAKRGLHAFIELGPTPALTGLGRRCLDDPGNLWLHSMHPKDDDAVFGAVAKLYAAGLPIHWAGFHTGSPSRPVELPSYAFDRRRYWLPLNGSGPVAGGLARHPLLGAETAREAGGVREFVAQIGAEQPAYLADHVAMGQVLFPAAGYVEILLALQEAVFGETSRCIEGLEIHEPLLPPAQLRTRLYPDGRVEIVSTAGEIERRHVTARIGAGVVAVPDMSTMDDAGVRLGAEDLYADFAALGMTYGAAFRGLRSVTRHGDTAVGEVAGSDTPPLEHLPPPILDAALQTAIGLADDDGARLPVRIEACQLLKKPMGDRLRCVMRADGADSANLVLLEGDRAVFVMRGIGYRRVETRSGLQHEPKWVRRRLPSAGDAASARVVVIGPRIAGAACVPTVSEAIELLREAPGDVCWFWRGGPAPTSVYELRAECERNFTELVRLIPALPAGKRLWLVTEGAQPVEGGEPSAAAALWGFGRVAGTELPSSRTTLVDIGPGEYDALPGEWSGGSDDRQIAYRAGRRYVRRLFPRHTGNVALQARDGTVEQTRVATVAPTGDQVQVRVYAAELNPEAVNASGEHGPIGHEAAGVVTAAGAQATFAVGDRVVVSHEGLLRRTVTVGSRFVAHIPSNMDFYAAAGQATSLLESRAVRPVQTTVFQAEELGEAIDLIARGGNIGSCVIDLAPADRPITISPGETYLITGGLGGLGRAVAAKLAQLGATHLILVGRGEAAAPDLPGVRVEVVAADISDPSDVEALAKRQIHGIVHAAGVLADAPLSGQSWPSLDKVFAAKVYGTWLLHKAFPQLRFFIGYSSIASLFGPPAQANYAAANAYLDAVLAGRPDGISVNWGPWAQVGMAAALGTARAKAIEAQGVRLMPPATMLRALTRVLAEPVRQVVIGEFDFARMAPSGDAFYSAVAPVAVPVRRLDLAGLKAKPQGARRAAIDEFIRCTIADVLQFDSADEIESQAEFVALGLDSLAAVAVKNNLELALGLTLPVSITFDYPSVSRLSEHLEKELVS